MIDRVSLQTRDGHVTASGGQPGSGWRRHLFYRREVYRTTWKLRMAVVLFAGLVVWGTRGIWTEGIGRSLTCDEQVAPSDALLLENFDPDYLVFERAAALQRAAVAPRIVVPVQADGDGETLNSVFKGTAEVMAGIAHISDIEMVPIPEVEPISLNAGKRIRDVLARTHVRSVIVVTPGFRSRRSALVYTSLLAPAGMTVRCVPVFGTVNARNWTETWHGIQDVALQFVKLQYYRYWVLF